MKHITHANWNALSKLGDRFGETMVFFLMGILCETSLYLLFECSIRISNGVLLCPQMLISFTFGSISDGTIYLEDLRQCELYKDSFYRKTNICLLRPCMIDPALK